MRNCPNCGNNKSKISYIEDDFKIGKCIECSLTYLLNIPDEGEIYEDYYQNGFSKDDYSEDSENTSFRDLYVTNQERIKILKNIKPSGKLLDVGCGRGLFLKTAQENGYEVYGIDVSKNALDYAKKELGLNVEEKNLVELIDENKKFDVITLWHVLEHFKKPVRELIKINSLLNEGGVCLIEVPNLNSIKFKLSKEKWKGGNHPLYHRTFFTNKTLEDTLRRSSITKFERLHISYKLPGRNSIYNLSKNIFNYFAMDAFLNYVVWK